MTAALIAMGNVCLILKYLHMLENSVMRCLPFLPVSRDIYITKFYFNSVHTIIYLLNTNIQGQSVTSWWIMHWQSVRGPLPRCFSCWTFETILIRKSIITVKSQMMVTAKVQVGMCIRWKLSSVCAFLQSDQSLRWALYE